MSHRVAEGNFIKIKLAVFPVAILLFFIFINVELPSGFVMDTVVALIVITGLVVSICFLVVCVWKKRLIAAVQGIILVGAIFMSLVFENILNTSKMKKSEEAISFINIHISAGNDLPKTLDDVEGFPEFSEMGIFRKKSYGYHQDGGNFLLWFEIPGRDRRIYDSNTETWYTQEIYRP